MNERLTNERAQKRRAGARLEGTIRKYRMVAISRLCLGGESVKRVVR